MNALVVALLLAVIPAAIAQGYSSPLDIASPSDGRSEARPYPTDRERASIAATNGNRRLSAAMSFCCSADACQDWCIWNRCIDGCCWSSKCDRAPRSAPSPPPLVDPVKDPFTRISVLNTCDSSIRVAIRYFSWNDNAWKSDGWWKVSPGQSAYIGNTANGIIYLYAEAVSRSDIWTGDHCFTFRNRHLCGRTVNIGSIGQGRTYTYSYNCQNHG